MKSELIVSYPNIGEVQFVPSATAKYIRISLKPFRGVKVTVPKWASMRQAKAYMEEKTDWILQTQSKLAVYEKRYTIFTPDTVFSTHSRQVQLLPWKSGQFRAQLSKNALKIFYPQEVDILSDQSQKTIRDYIIQSLRKEAKEYLPQRTEHLAMMHGFAYRGVAIKNLSSRWGSCSVANNINLSLHLVRLPQHLSDYVILHELAHTVHKNHSDCFWRCLDTLTNGKAKQLAAEIKQHHATCF